MPAPAQPRPSPPLTSTTALTVGAVREQAENERRVALDPSAVAALTKAGRIVVIEAGAGSAAGFADQDYTSVGADITTRAAVLSRSDIVAVVRAPDLPLVEALRPHQTLIGLLDPLNNLATVMALARQGVTAVAFEMLPRTLSRAQAMDAMSSQSNAAGYRAGIVAAEAFGRYLPMMITASGTAKPAKVMVIGAGVAGLQAIATTRRLGAVVTGYDVRAASRGEVESLGAQFLTPSVSAGAGAGGYARAMTPAEEQVQQAELADALTSFDVIITTARVPGRVPPMLVSAQTLLRLRPGSVCVDLGSSDRGGNVAGSVEGKRVVTSRGVMVIGAGNLASDLPASASQMYGHNVVVVIASLAPAGSVVIDPNDEVHRNIVISRDGDVTNDLLRTALTLDPRPSSASPAKVAAA